VATETGDTESAASAGVVAAASIDAPSNEDLRLFFSEYMTVTSCLNIRPITTSCAAARWKGREEGYALYRCMAVPFGTGFRWNSERL
jgi:hypothetical protein